jgi:hypothetical protein
MRPPAPCEALIEVCTARYLAVTSSQVEPFYKLQKAGGFLNADPSGQAFARERVAAGAAALRDFITTAWRASAKGSIGNPAITVDQVAGGVDPYDALYGDD